MSRLQTSSSLRVLLQISGFLKKFDIPTLILHGEDDQIFPLAASAPLSAKLVKNAQLKIYKGYPHGFFTTHHEQANADMLAFFKS